MPANYNHNELNIENIKLSDVAKQFGTPTYIYSKRELSKNWQTFDKAFKEIPHRICYSVKANSNLSILQLFASMNSGFDIVSHGELKRVLAAGGDPQKIIFSGVGKTSFEIEEAIKANIYCFNVESEPELQRINTIATNLQKTVNIALRINPNVDPKTHAHISTGLSHNKFGIESQDVIPLVHATSSYRFLNLIGIASHIGSQITELEPFIQSIDQLLEIYEKLYNLGINIKTIDIGGGLGIVYRNEQIPSVADYANCIRKKFANAKVEIIIEPGRAVVGNTGFLLTRIEYLKNNSKHRFAIVDAGMNDFMRPALYEAWHAILPVQLRSDPKQLYDIAGPVCESADIFGKNRELAIQAGDLLLIDAVGAYGFSMSSNYNSRGRAAEVMIDNNEVYLIRKRESVDDLMMLEKHEFE